jgi:lipooligosaccharide transport system permease protein
MATPPMLRVVEREYRVWMKLWRGLAFTTFVQPALYLAAMGVGLGKLVDAHSGSVNGLTYLEFVAPGLLVASAMQLAAGESMWPVLAGVKWMRFYEGVISTPIEAGQIFGGFVMWTAIRAAIGSSAFLLVAALIGAIPSWWGVLAIPAASLTAAAFAAPIAAFSIMQETDVAFPMIMRLAVLPLFLFSGTFFPISQLPSALQPLAMLSPLWHGVELARDATTGTGNALAIVGHIAFLVACIAAGSWWGVRRFNRRLHS